MKITKETPLQTLLELTPACRCHACSNSCRLGSGVLAPGDLEKIAAFLKEKPAAVRKKYFEEVTVYNKKVLRPKLLRNGKPFGKCVFFDEKKGCTVHPVKPLECKLAMGCKPYGEESIQWFFLNYVVDPEDSQSIREYAQHLQYTTALPGGKLTDLIKDKKELKKMLDGEM